MRKKLSLILAALSFALFSTIANAGSYETEYKNPLENLGQLQGITVAPITFESGIELDEFGKLRIQALIQEELKDMELPLTWSDSSHPTSGLSANQGKLTIHVAKFNRGSYDTEGYYERYVNRPVIYTGYHRSGYSNKRHRRGGRHYRSGPSFGMIFNAAPTISTSYVSPQTYNFSEVELRFTLQSANGDTSYWIYNQERAENPTRKASNPDKILKTTAKDAVKTFNKAYKKDLKEWRKQNR
jgi:hypothetical protein